MEITYLMKEKIAVVKVTFSMQIEGMCICIWI